MGALLRCSIAGLVSTLLPLFATTNSPSQHLQTQNMGGTLNTLIAQMDGGALDLVPGFRDQSMSLTIKKPLTLRGATNSSDQSRPTLVAEDGCISALAICAEKDVVGALWKLQLRHNGGKFEAESSNNSELGTACCVGVDGGFLNMTECLVSAVNGTCVGLAGANSTAFVHACEFINSSVGAAACQAAKLGCQSSIFYNHSHAAVVLIGNRTLGELDGNTMDRCGVLAISATEGAGLIAEGNTIERSSRAGISVVGKSWARASSNQILDNGEQGVIASSMGSAVVQECTIRGHEHGVSALDDGSRVWATNCDLESNKKGPLYAGIGGRVEKDGIVFQGEGIELQQGPVRVAPGTQFDPARDLAIPVSQNLKESDSEE